MQGENILKIVMARFGGFWQFIQKCLSLRCIFKSLTAMKRWLYLVLFVVVVGCNRQKESDYNQLVFVDSLLRHEYADSAMSVLATVRLADSNKECKAYYHLLLSQALYKTYYPIESDSTIQLSVDYYRQTGNKAKLVQALLYDGNILYGLGQTASSLQRLKEAEHLSKDVDDDFLRHNIFFSIACINSNCGENQLALDYIRKALCCSLTTGRQDHLAYDYQNYSVYHYNLGNYDSCKYYIDKCISLIDYLPKEPAERRARVWKSMGFAYYAIDRKQSRVFLEEAVSLAPMGEAYGALARLCLEENDTSKAKSLLGESLKDMSFPSIRIGNIQLLGKIEQEQGHYKRAAELSQQAYALKDSLTQSLQEGNIEALQIAIDRQADAKEANSAQRWLWCGIGLAILVSGIVVLILVRRSRQTKLKLDDVKRRVERLQAEERQTNKEVSRLTNKVESLKRRQQEQNVVMRNQQKDWRQHEKIMERGHRLFVELMDRGSTKLWTRDDFKDFRTYYDSVDSSFANEIAQKYEDLSQNLYLLALMEHLGKDDDEIMTTMSLSTGALRTARTRLSRKEKEKRGR